MSTSVEYDIWHIAYIIYIFFSILTMRLYVAYYIVRAGNPCRLWLYVYVNKLTDMPKNEGTPPPPPDSTHTLHLTNQNSAPDSLTSCGCILYLTSAFLDVKWNLLVHARVFGCVWCVSSCIHVWAVYADPKGHFVVWGQPSKNTLVMQKMLSSSASLFV